MRHAFPVRGILSVLAFVVAAPGPSTADVRSNPGEIVKRSAEAMAKLRTVSYDIEYKVTGFFSFFLPNVSGKVVLGKESSDGAKRFACKMTMRKGDSAEATEIVAGADGTTYYLIDHPARLVHADIDPQVLGKRREAVDVAITREFGMARPFEDVLKNGEIRYEREETVDGHECHVLNFQSSPMAPAMDWYISKTDFLPRRMRFAMKDPQGGEGAGEATLLNLTVNPKLDKDPFSLVVPDGYRRTDDFAP
jgi:hypothetical protein